MALDIGGAAGGAEMLQRVLAQKFLEAARTRDQDLEQQRLAQQQQYQNSVLQSQQDARESEARARAGQRAVKIAGVLKPGAQIDPAAVAALNEGDLGGLVQHTDATLGSRNITGAVQGGQTAPRIIGLASTANPGQAAKDTYTGTEGQLAAEQAVKDRAAQIEQARQDRAAQFEQSRQDKVDTAARAKSDKEDLLKVAASLRPAPQAPLVMVDTVDENGNPVRRIVKKQEGDSYVKPANATTSTRVSSAETVNAVGNDIIRKVSDPAYAATLGPALGRYSSLREFVGNPPPEYAELAGQIESYALANMGVHGMRSAQGAEQIKKLLDGRMTPEALAATIRGLNDFSTRFVEANKPKSGGGGSAPSTTSTGSKRIRYDMNGNQIKD